MIGDSVFYLKLLQHFLIKIVTTPDEVFFTFSQKTAYLM